MNSIDIFNKRIQTEKTTLVRFYTKWCRHCRGMDAEWKKLETDLGSNITLSDLDFVLFS